jgi:hypothetical protein
MGLEFGRFALLCAILAAEKTEAAERAAYKTPEDVERWLDSVDRLRHLRLALYLESARTA